MAGDCPRQRHTLLLAAGKLVGIASFKTFDMGEGKAMKRSFPAFADRQMDQCCLDICLHRQVGKKTIMLGNEAD